MEPIEAASFQSLLLKDIDKVNVLYIKVNEADDIISTLQQGNKLSKNILLLLNTAHFSSLESVQESKFPDLDQSQSLYVLCNHGYLSELASLYLEVAGFEDVYNVTGGLEALLKLEP